MNDENKTNEYNDEVAEQTATNDGVDETNDVSTEEYDADGTAVQDDLKAIKDETTGDKAADKHAPTSEVAATATAIVPEKKEEVRETLRELKIQNQPTVKRKRSPKELCWLIVKILFFPITLLAMGIRKAFKKFNVGIARKATIVFTCVFGLLIIVYAAFILANISRAVSNGDVLNEGYVTKLAVTSVVLIVAFIVIGSVIGYISSQYMISPIRKITNRIEEISEENLSARLDPVDSQDEVNELTDKINEMLESLEQAFERQENFVSDASHELKTPLAVIAGYANLMRRWGKDDPQMLNESVEAIARESENMRRIVDQLLWLAKLGNFSVNETMFNLYEVVDDVVDGYKMTATKHSVSLNGDPSITLKTDKNLVTEAVRTLVDNAIKYTPPGGEIKLSVLPVNGGVKIDVADNGVGISEEDCKHIFERFYRCDKARGRESGSCGLGLTICKSIVEMMGGTISVSSVLGEGSTFTIMLY